MQLHLSRVHDRQVIYRESENPKALHVKPVEMKQQPETTDTSEVEAESSGSDFDNVPDLYQEKKWVGGCNFKSRTPAFVKAAENVHTLIRKSAKGKHIGNIHIKYTDETKQGGGTLAKVHITDDEEMGEAQVHFWAPNKRGKEATVQIDKSSNGDMKHVDMLTSKIVKPFLDKLLAGATVKDIMKVSFKEENKQLEHKQVGEIKYACPICA